MSLRREIKGVTTGREQKEISCGGKYWDFLSTSFILIRQKSFYRNTVLSALGKEKHKLFKSTIGHMIINCFGFSFHQSAHTYRVVRKKRKFFAIETCDSNLIRYVVTALLQNQQENRPYILFLLLINDFKKKHLKFKKISEKIYNKVYIANCIHPFGQTNYGTAIPQFLPPGAKFSWKLFVMLLQYTVAVP